MRGALADEAAFPHLGVSGGMTARQFVALKFAAAAPKAESVVILGESEEQAKARRLAEDQVQMRRAFELADAFLAVQENNP